MTSLTGITADGEYCNESSYGNCHYGGDIGNKYEPFKDYLISRGYSVIGIGSFRTTFVRKNMVIKVPRNVDGETDNRVEARGWRKYRNNPSPEGIMMAPCRLMTNGCLMMFYVDRRAANSLDSWPEWVDWIDNGQVGIFKGRLVAYDFAVDLEERFDWEKEWQVYSEWFQERR